MHSINFLTVHTYPDGIYSAFVCIYTNMCTNLCIIIVGCLYWQRFHVSFYSVYQCTYRCTSHWPASYSIYLRGNDIVLKSNILTVYVPRNAETLKYESSLGGLRNFERKFDAWDDFWETVLLSVFRNPQHPKQHWTLWNPQLLKNLNLWKSLGDFFTNETVQTIGAPPPGIRWYFPTGWCNSKVIQPGSPRGAGAGLRKKGG